MSIVLTIGGTTIDRVATRTTLGNLRPYAKDGDASLSFSRVLGSISLGADALDGQEVTLTVGGTLVFKGDTSSHATHFDASLGWVREWHCTGLRTRADRVPMTDTTTQTDSARFNLPGDSPDFVGAYAGRTMGEIVLDVLEMPENSAALAALGIGNYTSSGTGAAATCVRSGSGVGSTFTITSGGSGYTVAPAVRLSGGGGSGATATATVSSGAVTAITLTSAGTGYTSAPTVLISRLPSATLADLDAMTVIPPFEVTIAGERVLNACEGAIQSVHPNHHLQLEADGTIRFLDPRTFTGDITLTMGDAGDPRVGMPSITTDWSNCYQRAQLRGHDQVIAVTLGVQPFPGSSASDGGLSEDFGYVSAQGTTFSNADAKAHFTSRDYLQPGQTPGTAQGVAAVTTGSISGISVQYSGYGYATAPTVTISGGSGSGATATATISSGTVSLFTVINGGSGYTSPPDVIVSPPAGAGQYDQGTCTCPSTTTVTVKSSNAKATWAANDWDQTDTGRHGLLVVRSDVISGYTQTYSARVVSNTSLSAGGTSTLTLDTALPATSYTAYQLWGQAGGAANVYRKYKVTNAAVASRLANYFPYPFAYRNSDGTAATLVSTPVGTVFYSSTGTAPYQQSGIGIAVDPSTGHVITSKPTCLVFASGVPPTPIPVDDFQAFLPVHSGGLIATYPADSGGVPQYEGTSHSVLGLELTKSIACPDWRDASNSANMLLFAREYLDSVKDIVVEGTISYYGLLSAALTPGHGLNIAGTGFTTGLESAALPVVAVDVEFRERSGGTSYATTLTFSNRRAPFSGAAFSRPAVVGQPFGGQGEALGMLAEMGPIGPSFGDMPAAMGEAGIGAMNAMAGAGLDNLSHAEGPQYSYSNDPADYGVNGRGNNFGSDGSLANILSNGGSTIHKQSADDVAANRGRGNTQEDFT